MMAARPRARKNRDLPDNLYVNAKGYYYRHPLTKKNFGMGTDRAKAIAAAKKLNQRLLPNGNDLVARVLGGTTISELVARYRAEYLPDKRLSPRTADEVRIRLNRIERELGARAVEEWTLKELTDWLSQLTRAAYIKYRTQWIDLYRFACATGLADRNIAELTLAKDAPEKVRKRWTLEQYRATRAVAEPWLQVAMDVALTSLQRREDLVAIRKKESFVDGKLLVYQIKTGKRLAIDVGGTLAEAIARAKAMFPFCPFLLGRKPVRDRRGSKV
ncbi:MAG TPA: phage integrase Arm DNA-binding domain-containing protein, partial [Porticoccaceae bacterium]